MNEDPEAPMFRPELIRTINEDRERSIADLVRHRNLMRERPARWVVPPPRRSDRR
jgi:hypothetical protein